MVIVLVDYVGIIKARRKKFGYSQYKMAALVEITQPFYNEIERGTKNPSLEVFFKICEVLHISVMSEASDDDV